MMTDYIRRTDAVKIAEKYGLANGSVLGRHTGLADCIARDISELPAADVAEVVHGRWYMLDDCANAGLYCSACGRRVHHEEFAYKKLKSKYCPHCGARMDRGGTAHDESERDFQTLCRRLGRGRGYQDRRQT